MQPNELRIDAAEGLHRGFYLSKTIPTTIPKTPGLNHLTFVTFRAGGLSCLFRFFRQPRQNLEPPARRSPASVGNGVRAGCPVFL